MSVVCRWLWSLWGILRDCPRTKNKSEYYLDHDHTATRQNHLWASNLHLFFLTASLSLDSPSFLSCFNKLLNQYKNTNQKNIIFHKKENKSPFWTNSSKIVDKLGLARGDYETMRQLRGSLRMTIIHIKDEIDIVGLAYQTGSAYNGVVAEHGYRYCVAVCDYRSRK